MKQYSSKEEYLDFLSEQDRLPRGFQVACQALEFYPAEKQLDEPLPMNLSLITLEDASPSFAALFTRSALPGHPVRIGRELMNKDLCQGILINNKISNVCTQGGKEDSLQLKALVEEQIDAKGFILPCSTGIIGWKLPITAMEERIPSLCSGLQSKSLLPAAKGIMTTDSFPKMRSVSVDGVTISGIAKGAGMIEPNLATMLVYILTDAKISRKDLQQSLNYGVEQSFNRISIDSDQSTSDTVFALSSQKGPAIERDVFQRALTELCKKLADDLVRNGEGTGHVIELTMTGAPSDQDALGLAKGLINSPLTKTAIFGNDPNVGRFLQAIGDYAGNHGIRLNPDSINISLGGVEVLTGGIFQLNDQKEQQLEEYLKSCSLPTPCPGYPSHDRRVKLKIDLGIGSGATQVLGSDLSYEYVRENGDYRS